MVWRHYFARSLTTPPPPLPLPLRSAAESITFLWVFTYPLTVYAPLILPSILAFIVTTVETIGDVTTTAEVSKLEVTGPDHFQVRTSCRPCRCGIVRGPKRTYVGHVIERIVLHAGGKFRCCLLFICTTSDSSRRDCGEMAPLRTWIDRYGVWCRVISCRACPQQYPSSYPLPLSFPLFPKSCRGSAAVSWATESPASCRP